jgi:putative transcriptional regulator
MNPSPNEIKQARLTAGLTQTKAANIIGYTMRSWQMWEAGKSPMRKVLFDTFLERIKAHG